MIRALVLDVDGVLVGEKIGFNSPNPHPDVITRLSIIRQQGIPIVLCTGKPHYSVSAIIEGAGLNNPHITNGGSVIIDPIKQKIVQAYPIVKTTVSELLIALERHAVYTELYTTDAYYLNESQQSELTTIHAHVLQRKPLLVDSLMDIASAHDVVKIMPIAKNEAGIAAIDNILAPFNDSISQTWGLHPIANPHQFCGITATGISKRQTTLDVLTILNVDPKDVLGVGDSTSDWKYMELTGFVAVVNNAQDKLKELVRSKGDTGFIGGHVDENGILTIFDHFHLPPSGSHP